MSHVLIIDDDESTCTMLVKLVRNIDHQAEYDLTLKEGLQKTMSGAFDAVFLDVNMPDGNGLEALKEIRKMSAPPEVIIITGEGNPDGAETAIKNDAWDYIQKPISPKKVILPLKRVLQYRDNVRKALKQSAPIKREGIVGSSPQINACIKNIAQAARCNANVLLTGETGTGKELFAHAVHENSSRSNENFVVVDCAALPETLVESTLFGHAKGAFTGADRPHDGLIKMAHGGTLFLDEVGELSLKLQKAFLRVLQEGRYRPVGSEHEIESNFRLISATNKDLDQSVKAGHFRNDLLYRLTGITIELPPLRERSQDIPVMINYYSNHIAKRYKIKPKKLSPDFIDALNAYEWPGNIRELANTLESAVSQAWQEPILFSKHLPTHVRIQTTRAKVVLMNKPEGNVESIINSAEIVSKSMDTITTFKDFRLSVLEEAEKKYFQDLMAYTNGNINDACRNSNLGRARIYTMLKKHNISKHG